MGKCPLESAYKVQMLVKNRKHLFRLAYLKVAIPLLEGYLGIVLDGLDKLNDMSSFIAEVFVSVNNLINAVDSGSWILYAIDQNIRKTVESLDNEIKQINTLISLAEKIKAQTKEGKAEELRQELKELSQQIYTIINNSRIDMEEWGKLDIYTAISGFKQEDRGIKGVIDVLSTDDPESVIGILYKEIKSNADRFVVDDGNHIKVETPKQTNIGTGVIDKYLSEYIGRLNIYNEMLSIYSGGDISKAISMIEYDTTKYVDDEIVEGYSGELGMDGWSESKYKTTYKEEFFKEISESIVSPSTRIFKIVDDKSINEKMTFNKWGERYDEIKDEYLEDMESPSLLMNDAAIKTGMTMIYTLSAAIVNDDTRKPEKQAIKDKMKKVMEAYRENIKIGESYEKGDTYLENVYGKKKLKVALKTIHEDYKIMLNDSISQFEDIKTNEEYKKMLLQEIEKIRTLEDLHYGEITPSNGDYPIYGKLVNAYEGRSTSSDDTLTTYERWADEDIKTFILSMGINIASSIDGYSGNSDIIDDNIAIMEFKLSMLEMRKEILRNIPQYESDQVNSVLENLETFGLLDDLSTNLESGEFVLNGLSAMTSLLGDALNTADSLVACISPCNDILFVKKVKAFIEKNEKSAKDYLQKKAEGVIDGILSIARLPFRCEDLIGFSQDLKEYDNMVKDLEEMKKELAEMGGCGKSVGNKEGEIIGASTKTSGDKDSDVGYIEISYTEELA